MAATALVAARLEPELKQRAHDIIEREGMTETQIIRSAFERIVAEGSVPKLFKEQIFIENESAPESPHGRFHDLVEFAENGPFSGHDWTWLTNEAFEQGLADALEEKLGGGDWRI